MGYIARQLVGAFIDERSKVFHRIGQREANVAHSRAKGVMLKSLISKQDDEDDDIPVDIGFDPGDVDAARTLQQSNLNFIRDFSRSQRASVRNALVASERAGDGPAQAARRFRDAIGLTDNQQAAVDNYRDMLERGSSEALTRELRDKRSDSKVQSAIDRGDILDATQIDRMTSRYADNMLRHRADTIARTESHRAASSARHHAWLQMMRKTGLDDDRVTRTWNATLDSRTRDTHAEMDGQQQSGSDPFESSSGAILNFPGDPQAPPEETINCRCVVTYDVNDEEE
jgi:hypothetical protein